MVQEHVRPAYAFELDTHGHYLSLSNESLETVSYYTGTWHRTDEWGSWAGEELVAAQFVDLETGEDFTAPVTYEWATTHTGTEYDGYYDITNNLYGDETYVPVALGSHQNIYGDSYAILQNSTGGWIEVEVDGRNNKIPGVRNVGDIYYNADTVNFVVGSGRGSSVGYTVYEGVDELFAAYEDEYGVGFDTINLQRAIAIVEEVGGGYYATTIFAFEDADSLLGGTIYFPEDFIWDGVTDNYYWVTMGYLNGESNATRIRLTRDEAIKVTAAGFYSYSIDPSTSLWTLNSLASKTVTLTDDNSTFRTTDDAWNSVIITSDGTEYTLANTALVVDVTNPSVNDSAMSVEDLWEFVLDGDTYTATFVPGSNNSIAVLYVTMLDNDNA